MLISDVSHPFLLSHRLRVSLQRSYGPRVSGTAIAASKGYLPDSCAYVSFLA